MDEPHFYFHDRDHKATIELYAHNSKPGTMFIELKVEDEKDKNKRRSLKRSAFRGFIIADFTDPPDMRGIFGDGKIPTERPKPALCIRLETMTGHKMGKFRDFDALGKYLFGEYLASSESFYRGTFMMVD